MDFPRSTMLAAALLATTLLPVSAHAGQCAADIDRVQAQTDAWIDATAGRGRMGTESTAATDHREPTPASIARAEQRLDGATAGQTALAALTQARQADAAGDWSACKRALDAARRALGH
ncbi:MAG TPA: hypothetical protein VGU19_10160 [Microvirga sp.]|jgi:hypothetical protein|nr:hypothetical protein [Microvirga sp.]